jgi:hypothetical protein
MAVEYRRGGNLAAPPSGADSLADILERVLDKGVALGLRSYMRR